MEGPKYHAGRSADSEQKLQGLYSSGGNKECLGFDPRNQVAEKSLGGAALGP